MKVRSMMSFPVVAVFANISLGFSEETTIGPYHVKAVLPKFTNGEGNFYMNIEGEILCQEYGDSDTDFIVQKGTPLIMENGQILLIIRHHEDPPITYSDLGWD